MERNGEKTIEERRLKFGGEGIEGERGIGKKEIREKESRSKVWVVLILIVSVIVSLVFSMKNGIGVPREENKVNSSKGGSSLFGPAEYEYEK